MSVNAALGLQSHLMGGSKGAHLVVENPALLKALNGHMVYFGTKDGRVNLVYPFMDRVMIGSTDIKIDDPDQAVCSQQEADYLRGVISEIFPDIPVTEDQIRHRFSGVRPLPNADGDIGLVTRDHSIAELKLPGGAPVLCLIGGKWTTFRGFSEQTADKVLAVLGRNRVCGTHDMQIGGGKGYPAPEARPAWVAEVARKTGLPEARVEVLLARYGTRAADIAPALGQDRALHSLPDYSREELEWIMRNERVGGIDDLLYRRTTIAMSGHLNDEVRAEIEDIVEDRRKAG